MKSSKTMRTKVKIKNLISEAKDVINQLGAAIDEAKAIEYVEVDPEMCIDPNEINKRIDEILSDESNVDWKRIIIENK